MKEADAVVFVVDDDSSIREAISSLLGLSGLRVETFATAQEFLRSNRPDLPGCVVLDVELPGLSGLDLQRELAAHGVRLPIIFITGYGDISMSVRAMKAGALEFLTKPFHDQDLLDAIQQALERDRAERQHSKEVAELRGSIEARSCEVKVCNLLTGRGSVALACPWASRTVIFRKLKKLENVISMSITDPFMGANGWAFSAPDGSLSPGSTPDEINGARFLYEVYLKARPDYTGRVTVPVLWDKRSGTIVNNESSEIIRMLNSAFDERGESGLDFYPEDLREEIDRVNAVVYDSVNNGVYKCGFATSQQAYDEAFDQLFKTLDELELRLAERRYLVGSRLTEADWRLFTTLVRFDSVYHGHFKCNLRRIIDYPNLWNYTRELYQVPGVAETVNLFHIKRHYYASHVTINPTRIVPKGPAIDFSIPHNRARLA